MCSLNVWTVVIVLLVLLILVDISLAILIKREERVAKATERKKKSYWSWNIVIQIDVAAVIVALGIILSRSLFPCGSNLTPAPSPTVAQNPTATPERSPNEKPRNVEILIQLRTTISVTVENNFYIIQPYAGTNELVQGKKGTYYRVELKSMIPTEKVLFKGGEYVIDGFNPKFSESINHFNEDIINNLKAGGVPFQIYVMGSADQIGAGLHWNLAPGYEYRSVRFHKRLGSNLFSSELEPPVVIPNPYTNNDLPNLRAEFIRNTLGNDPYNLSADILEGGITENYSQPLDRNVVFLLYIAWPESTKREQ